MISSNLSIKTKPTAQYSMGYPTRVSTWAMLGTRPPPTRTWRDHPVCRGQAAGREIRSQGPWFLATGKQGFDCRHSGPRVGIANSNPYPGLQRGMLLKTLWSVKPIKPGILLPSITSWDRSLPGFCAQPHRAYCFCTRAHPPTVPFSLISCPSVPYGTAIPRQIHFLPPTPSPDWNLAVSLDPTRLLQLFVLTHHARAQGRCAGAPSTPPASLPDRYFSAIAEETWLLGSLLPSGSAFNCMLNCSANGRKD